MLTFSFIILLVTGSESQGRDRPGSNDNVTSDNALTQCLYNNGGRNWKHADYNTCYKVWKNDYCKWNESKICCPETCAKACFQEEMLYFGEGGLLPRPNFKPLKSAYECQKDCDETEGCSHWTWYGDSHFQDIYQCQLRKEKGKEEPRPFSSRWFYDHISGSKNCSQTKTLASVSGCLRHNKKWTSGFSLPPWTKYKNTCQDIKSDYGDKACTAYYSDEVRICCPDLCGRFDQEELKEMENRFPGYSGEHGRRADCLDDALDNCLAVDGIKNKSFVNPDEAFRLCTANPDCGMVMKDGNGKYYLRKTDDEKKQEENDLIRLFTKKR